MICHLDQVIAGDGSVTYVIRVLNHLCRYFIKNGEFVESIFFYCLSNSLSLPILPHPSFLLFFQFKFSSYNTLDDDYDGYDYSLYGRLSAVRIVFLYRFVQEVSCNIPLTSLQVTSLFCFRLHKLASFSLGDKLLIFC